MLTVTSVIGNLASDKKLGGIYRKLDKDHKVERITLSRMEAQKTRLRRTSDKGSDVAINLETGSMLRHGDVLFADANKMIIVEYEAEDVLCIRIREGLPAAEKVAVAIKLGHMIGNLHRPIRVKDNMTCVPVQKSEAANIQQILSPIIEHIEIQQTKMIFEPEEEIRVHAH